MMKAIYRIVLLLFVSVLATSCIKEDLDDCDNVTIYFQYLADGDTDVLHQYMSKVDLYVFDEGGHILGVGHYHEDELKNYAAVPSFKLRPGTYKVVAVGNAYDQTEVVNLTSATSFEDIYIEHPAWRNGGVVTGHDDNYLGEKIFTIPSMGTGVMYRDTVTLYSSHIDVEIEIKGLPAPTGRQTGDIPYTLKIEHSNASTNFHNQINTSEKGTCIPTLVYDYEDKCYRTDDLALFRMDTDGMLDPERCEHIVKLEDAEGNVLVNGNLYEFLKLHEDDIDVTKQEALLPISIQFSGLDVVITLPDWYIVNGKPEWN